MEIHGLIGQGRFGYVYSGKMKHWNIALKFSTSDVQLEIEKQVYLYLQDTIKDSRIRRIPFFFL